MSNVVVADTPEITLARQPRRAEAAAPKIVFNGFVFAPTGFGTAARSYVHAFHRAQIEMSIIDRSREQNKIVEDPLVASLLNRPIHADFFIGHTEPLDFAPMRAIFPRLIALTTWEAETLPDDYVEVLNQVCEVWTPSRYNAEVFAKQIKAPVFQLPHPVHVPPASVEKVEEIERRFDLTADDFVVLTVATWQERKNLAGTVEAFLRAFAGEPKAKLLIKTAFGFTHPQAARMQVARAIQRSGTHPKPAELNARIKIFQDCWSEELVAALMRRANCYLSLHRSEGWCYPLFDAACAGTPVVATGYSGPMDYLDPLYHRLARYELVPAERGNDPDYFHFTPEMVWAAPDAHHAVELMRAVYENPELAQRQAQAGAAQLRQRYSLEAVGRMARERLQQLAASL
jgi:glycosyltransferase involved in cell wall biosynthesis